MTTLPVELLTLGSISVPIFNKERYVKVTVFNKFHILTDKWFSIEKTASSIFPSHNFLLFLFHVCFFTFRCSLLHIDIKSFIFL